MEQPKANRGWLVADAGDGGESRSLLAAAASAEETPARASVDSQPRDVALTPASAPEREAAPTGGAETPTGAEVPAGEGALIALPKLTETELEELMAVTSLKLEAGGGYRKAGPEEARFLRPAPEGVTARPTLAKTGEAGLKLIRAGYRKFSSQTPFFWAQGGVVSADDGTVAPNPDLALVAEAVEAFIAAREALNEQLGLGDLAHRLIQLSYIDVKGAIEAVGALGVATAPNLAGVKLPIDPAALPMVVPMPTPSDEQVTLLGESEAQKAQGAFELSVTPSVASTLFSDANTAPASQLLVYFHPARPEQFSRVKRLLTEFVDRPARQIFVEGMVMEISEEGLNDLGIEWQFREGNFETVAGSLAAGAAAQTFQFSFDDLRDFEKNWTARIKALVREGKAEILSRPSVLTLNNRQATIRVGTDIPIATSQEQGVVKDVSKLSFNFKYLATGISLNVLPRMNEAGDEVSMLIDTIVSAVVPGADLELRASSGEVLASAPTISTRRIQTYARIANNTPFIIGGLISKENTVERSKVPLLGDVPYLGVLFRSKRAFQTKREVIIVLTPHVLVEEGASSLGRYMPKDEDKFDEFGNELFRDVYRIRGEDLFDLTFLTENPRLKRYARIAREALDRNYQLADVEPYSHFADGQIPGERILVHRMMYEVIKRLSSEKGGNWLDQRVNPERLILFKSQRRGGYSVEFLEDLLASLGDGESARSFFEAHPGEALAVTFEERERSVGDGGIEEAPVPRVETVLCADRERWARLLWELNQPAAPGAPDRHTILIHQEEDLVRLQRAILLKKLIALNGGAEQITLRNFSLGKILLMPEPKPNQTHLIAQSVAQYFFETEHYYAATTQLIERVLREMESFFGGPEAETTP